MAILTDQKYEKKGEHRKKKFSELKGKEKKNERGSKRRNHLLL